jgi:hypothetical protein
MVQTIAADKLTLYELEQHFALQYVPEAEFFPEWQGDLPALSLQEAQRLERLKAVYANLSRRSVLENIIKMAIISPLLDLAGFFLPPFYVTTEEEVQLIAQEDDLLVRGRMDILVLNEQFWVLVIEAKRAEFSLKVGIPQVLAYMLAAPQTARSLYGLVTNGSNFVFLKLVRQDVPRYARSHEFILEQGEDLETVLQILKRFAAILV